MSQAIDRYYSYEEICDCVNYILDNRLDCSDILKDQSKKLIIEQLNLFENLLLEAINPIREQGIYIIVCTNMIWQVVRNLLNISGNENFLNQCNAPQICKDIMEKANLIFKLHSFIRHPTENNLAECGWIINRQWTDSQKNLVRNIAQIIYKLVMSIRLMINLEKRQSNNIDENT